MIVRGLRLLAVALLSVCGMTAAVSLLVALAAGVSVLRAVSGGFLVVGSLLFVVGAVVGIRDPARSLRRETRLLRRGGTTGGPASWAEAFHLSATLVGFGLVLVLLGVALHPRATF